MQRIITLTTDFGWKDHYVASIKGALYRTRDAIQVVDVTHDVPTHDVAAAAFFLRNVYRDFPEGTIHIASVLNFPFPESRLLVFEKNGYYFIGPDNGLFTLIFEDLGEEVYEITLDHFSSFPLKEIYAQAVAHICRELPLQGIGIPSGGIRRRLNLAPTVSDAGIQGIIIHIDHFDNAIVNITQSLFEQHRKGRDFAIFFRRNDPITQLSRHYHDVPVGEPVCIFNTSGYLELAVNLGKAASLYGLKPDDSVKIHFYN